MSDTPFPFAVREISRADPGASALFQRAFGAPPPDFPRHFIATLAADGAERVVAYIHYTEFDAGVYLCGGLCVDSRAYRALDAPRRGEIARRGSLSRWFIDQSIAALGQIRAVFAYTGDVRSRRDAFALGYEPTESKFLLVQWHAEPLATRPSLVARVAAHGPF
jgi:hypothetical protein